MSETQIVSVDVRKLGLGMSHAFQGMAEVCASLGVPKDSMLGAVDEAEKVEAQSSPSALKQKTDEQVPKAKGKKGGARTQEVNQDADQANRPDADVVDNDDNDTVTGSDAADATASVKGQDVRGAVVTGNTGSSGTSASASGKKAPTATADDITRILAAKVQQKKIKAADAKALLQKYGAKSVSTLDSQYYDAVLEEASSM